jgi:hypothetical protein
MGESVLMNSTKLGWVDGEGWRNLEEATICLWNSISAEVSRFLQTNQYSSI